MPLQKLKKTEQLVIKPPLGIALGQSDLLVFCGGDPALPAPLYFRPHLRSQERPVEPAQAEGQIMQAAQVMIGASGARPQRGQEVGGVRFDDGFIPDARQRGISHGAVIPELGAGSAMRAKFFHDRGPGSPCRIGVAGGEVNPAQVPVEHWPLSRLVLGVKEPFRIRPVSGVQAFLLAALVSLHVKDAVASEHPIPLPHNFHHSCEDTEEGELPVSG